MAKSRHPCVKSVEESGQSYANDRPIPPAIDFDGDGIPIDFPVADWLGLFGPDGLDDPRATRRLLAVLRFSRADGSAVFSPGGRSLPRLKELESIATRLRDPSLSSVVALWLPPRSPRLLPPSPTPTPSDARPDRPLAILRPDWGVKGDLVAIDHRRPGAETLLEVASRGRRWVGPSWTSSTLPGKFGQARPTRWRSDVFADCSEWSYKVGANRVTRSVVLLKGRSMVLLGQQTDGVGNSSEVRLALPDGIDPSIVAGTRSVLLTSGRNRSTARIIPLGLPAHDRPTDRGSIAIEGRDVVIRQSGEGRRRWLPVLVCWGKAPTTWRPLTVSYRSKASREDVAVASRVAWGPYDDGLVVYRSLGPAALRSFLGHQTGAGFLVGAFTKSGDVRPIFKADG